jgi:hypothetical protein
MKMFCTAAVCLALAVSVFSEPGLAQTADTDPATKDQVELLLRTMHSHDMVQRTMEAMLKPMDQMFHDQFRKDGKKIPADFQPRFSKIMADLLKNMPWDEMTQATVPAYQNHFTNDDINNLIAFYSSPTGQKYLQEMPEVTGESMQAMMPIMLKYMKDAQGRMQQQVKDMEQNAPKAEASAAQ